jgi:hypothetical protein
MVMRLPAIDGHVFPTRTRDGAVLYGEPVREEVEQCVQTVVGTIVDHLGVPAWPTENPVELAAAIADCRSVTL